MKMTPSPPKDQANADDWNRRNFLKLATAAVAVPGLAAASLSGPLAGQETGSNGPQLTIYKSLKWGMVGLEGTMEEKFAELKSLGFQGVELDSPDGIDPRKAAAASDKTGLLVDGVVDSRHWKVRMTDPDAQQRTAAGDDLITALQAAHVAGGTTALLVPGHGGDGSEEEVRTRATEQIRRAIPIAAKLGVCIVIENVWNHMFYDHDGPDDQTADALAEFVDSFHSPWVGVQFDIGNHQKYGFPADWIRRLGRRIVKLDAKDWGKESGFCKIGDGDVDWADVRLALLEIGYCGWAAAEVAGGDHARLSDISRRMDAAFGLASS